MLMTSPGLLPLMIATVPLILRNSASKALNVASTVTRISLGLLTNRKEPSRSKPGICIIPPTKILCDSAGSSTSVLPGLTVFVLKSYWTRSI